MDEEWKRGDACIAPSRQTDRYVTSEIIDMLETETGGIVAVFTQRDGSSTRPEFEDISLLLEVPQEHPEPVSWKKNDLCLVREDRYKFRLAVIIGVETEVAVVKFLSVFTQAMSSEETVSITCLYTLVKKRNPQQANETEWKKGNICLAPSRQTDRYVTSEIKSRLKDESDEKVAAVTHLGASSTGPELTDIALLLEVPQEHHRPASWKKDDLCLVREDRYSFRLAIIIHVETEVAVVKFLSVFPQAMSSEETVSITCLYTVVKKRTPQKKNETGLGKKLGLGLAGAIGMAVLAPIAVPMAVGALGFGAGGIVAGSSAASIMASYGGAVTAGSACAIMQSIGAAGLSATGFLISGAVGGLVGGAAGVAAGAAADRKDKKVENQEQEPPTAQLF